MGVFDEGYTRLKILIILFAFLFFVGTCETIFFGAPESDVYGDFQDQEKIQKDYEGIAAPKEPPTIDLGVLGQVIDWVIGFGHILIGIGTAFASFLGILYGAITFTLYPTIPVWMTQIMAPIMITVTIIVIYIIVDITYDIVKAL